MQLNPRQLEAFRSVMVSGSMTVAAERLKISQPAVSALIRDLEKRLEIRLFRREGNRLIPGAEAQRLFREVDRFYQGMEQIERVALDLKSARIGTLRVASMHTLGLSLLSECVRQFSLSRPELAISLDVRNSLGVMELAAAHQIDIGFVQMSGDEYPGVDVLPLPSVAAVCVLPRGHALARKRSLKITDLQDEALISLNRNSPVRMRLEMELDAAGVTCKRSVVTSLGHVACSLVAGGLGLTVVDPFTARRVRDPGVVWRPLSPAVQFQFSMVLPSHQPRSKVVEDFIKLVKEQFKASVASS
ncbi:LysR substrate-binding domain-containing protein [Cupriavidus metallidurans]|uniref:LysR substrate-binding domain-containing protein n=1 Tax=Cupriavidus TaxID=106589 RepID=UPI000E92DC5A|nr:MULTISPECIES: LysR substrate-binding domain-containing protein [unclassified Cupriavidus]GMG93481.1 regulatory protein NocR [Cupriavidus sp. TKC]HBD36972.1 LysR family transcriptional regulator [Cupriavidus sp.]HBO78736.1 LysR family transcriptional regulator [Cupriavidus sp.]